MPELPEVETICRGLRPVLEGAEICSATLRRKNLRFPFQHDLIEKIIGCKICTVSRRAKYLVIRLDNGHILLSHLGMSGSWRVHSQPHHQREEYGQHDHFIMSIKQDKDGVPGDIVTLSYNDPRRFGFLLLFETSVPEEIPYLNQLGIEPFRPVLSGSFLQDALGKKFSSLKAVLLDQKIIAGLGNIYVCEALWRARLSPLHSARQLGENSLAAKFAADRLACSIIEVIDEAIMAGGTHLRNYVQIDGTLGKFQHQFRVYGRENDACFSCRNPIKRIVQNGRSTFYCAMCQH